MSIEFWVVKEFGLCGSDKEKTWSVTSGNGIRNVVGGLTRVVRENKGRSR